MSIPSFSLLLCNFNQEPFLRKAIQTALSQSLRPDEIIIIDDCSTDNSIETIREIIIEEPEIRLIKNDKNFGVCYTLNRIVQEATCDYFHLVGPDDPMLPGFYEKSLNLISQYPQAGLCSTIVQCQDVKENNLVLAPAPPYFSQTGCFLSSDQVLSSYMEYGTWYKGVSTIWRREPYLETGGFAPAELESFVDTFKFFQLALKYGACFVPEVLYIWTMTSSGYSSKARHDPQASLDLLNRAERLMRTTYHDQFPVKFVEKFKRNELATFANVVFKKIDSDQKYSSLLLKQAFPENCFMDGAVLFSSRILMLFQNIFLKIWLGFRLRRFNGVFLLRMFYHVKGKIKKVLK